jgi:hypothetical protein
MWNMHLARGVERARFGARYLSHGEDSMSGISNTQISLLVDIGQKASLTLNPEKRLALEALITAGFVTPSDENDAAMAPYELTAKAQRFLRERGAGLNEA